jgi:hypothetical protein
MGREHARILQQARESDTTAQEAWERIRSLNEVVDWRIERLLPEVADQSDGRDDPEDQQTSATEPR